MIVRRKLKCFAITVLRFAASEKETKNGNNRI